MYVMDISWYFIHYMYYICVCIATQKREILQIMWKPTKGKKVNYVYSGYEVTHYVVGKLVVTPSLPI